jgi:hypothetical protein
MSCVVADVLVASIRGQRTVRNGLILNALICKRGVLLFCF